MTFDRLGAWWKPVRRLRHSVVLRLLATVFAFSCAITLILTVLQLHRDYDAGIARISERLVDVDRSYRDSLGEALWRLDQPQIQLELDGILRLADIRAAEVRETKTVAVPMVVTAGGRATNMAVSREFPLVYRVQGKEQRIGTLYVEATLANLYHDLTRTALVILVSQGANTFLVSLFTIYIMSRLVTRHLTAIARTVGDYDFHEAPQPFRLQRSPPAWPDELDRMVAAFNAMGTRLHRAYLDEREAAAEREARQLAEAANRAKGEFLANLSHELRTPLNGILGYAQILRRDPALDERQRDGVAVIQHSGEHLLTLIDETLDFAKIEAGKLRIEIRDVLLGDLVAAIRQIVAVKAEQKELGFVCRIADDAPAGVRADERRLRQVLLNLLSNAVKFTDAGSVSLTIGRGANGAARFDVRDTGIGVGADQYETIFMPFEQVGRRERHTGGTGLGLTISRQFVRAMGGELQVESRLGEGSLFWFELPAAFAEPDLPAGGPSAIVTGYEGPRLKVLVIDDVQVNRAVVVELLGRLGFMASEVGSGAEGLEKARKEQPELILTDIVMPGIDGLEVTRMIRDDPALRHIPIIGLSASPSAVAGDGGRESGISAFVSKPVDFDALLAKMAALLELQWTYAPALDEAAPLDLSPEARFEVPVAQMDELYRLAREGNMRDIVRWAEHAAAADPLHAPFAARLRQLAKAYQSKRILQLVEQHLAGDATS